MPNQVIPANETFAAPLFLDSATGGGGSGSQGPPWVWNYLNIEPGVGVASSDPTYTGGPMMHAIKGDPFGPLGGYPFPLMTTDRGNQPGGSLLTMRGWVCRHEAVADFPNIEVKATYGIADVSVAGLGAGGEERSGGRRSYSLPDAINAGATEDVGMPGGGVGNDQGTMGVGFSSGSHSTYTGKAPLYAAWNGACLLLRVGEAALNVGTSVSAVPVTGGSGTDPVFDNYYVTRMGRYAFMAYPEINSSSNTLDLKLSVWMHSSTLTSTSRMVIEQTVTSGVSRIDFGRPYYLRAQIKNTASGHPQMECFLGKYNTPHGGVVEVQCFKNSEFDAGAGSYGVGTSVSHNATLGTVTDTHSTKITDTAARSFGWSMGSPRVMDVGPRLFETGSVTMSVVDGLYSLRVRNVDTDTTTYLDKFERTPVVQNIPGNTSNAVRRVTDQFGHHGPSLLGSFTLDISAPKNWANGAPTDEGLALHRCLKWMPEPVATTFSATPLVEARLNYGNDSTATPPQDVFRQFVYRRPSTQFYNHHRSLEFKPPVDDPDGVGATVNFNAFEIGIWLRGTHNGTRTSGTGLVAYWETDGANALTYMRIQIVDRSVLFNQSYTKDEGTRIASKTYSTAGGNLASAPAIYDGAFHKLDFRAEEYSGSPSPGSAAIYHVEIDSAPLELDDSGALAASVTTTPYDVTHPNPTYYSGTSEAFHFWSNIPQYLAGNRWFSPPVVKNWLEGALTADPDAGGGVDAESIVVAGEGTPSGFLNTDAGALAFTGGGSQEVEAEVDISYDHPIRTVKFGSGHEFTAPKATKSRRTYRVRVHAMEESVYLALVAFLNSHRGGEVPFYFQSDMDLDATTGFPTNVVVWFVGDTLSVQRLAPGTFSAAFSLQELIVA